MLLRAVLEGGAVSHFADSDRIPPLSFIRHVALRGTRARYEGMLAPLNRYVKLNRVGLVIL